MITTEIRSQVAEIFLNINGVLNRITKYSPNGVPNVVKVDSLEELNSLYNKGSLVNIFVIEDGIKIQLDTEAYKLIGQNNGLFTTYLSGKPIYKDVKGNKRESLKKLLSRYPYQVSKKTLIKELEFYLTRRTPNKSKIEYMLKDIKENYKGMNKISIFLTKNNSKGYIITENLSVTKNEKTFESVSDNPETLLLKLNQITEINENVKDDLLDIELELKKEEGNESTFNVIGEFDSDGELSKLTLIKDGDEELKGFKFLEVIDGKRIYKKI